MSMYSEERKQSVLKKMMVTGGVSILQLSREEGISDATLYNWRKQARQKGLFVPDRKSNDGWSSEARFAVVIECASMSEAELSEYCRKKGLYPEQVATWKSNCMQANDQKVNNQKLQNRSQKQDKKKIRQLEKELLRKDKALAETTALLVLRKKFNALWEQDEDE